MSVMEQGKISDTLIAAKQLRDNTLQILREFIHEEKHT